MFADNQILSQTDDKEVSKVALKTFFNITKGWQLSNQEEMILLGEPARSTFFKWRKQEGPTLSRDTLERISYIIGIYKALRILFPTQSQANAWPSKTNREFGDKTAIEFMCQGNVVHLSDVRRYLDSLCN